MENDQNPVRVHTNPCTMEIDECQLAANQDTSHKAKSNCGREEEKKKQKDSIKALDQLVQRVKETTKHCTEEQIYNVLRDCNMDPNQAVMRLLLLQSQGPSSLESARYGHEGPSRVFECLSPLESERPEREGSSSLFEGLSNLESKRHYRPSSFFEGLSTFEADEPFQIQSDTAHQQVNSIIPERRDEKNETKQSQEWKRLYEQSQKWMLDEEVVKQISKNVINLPGFEALSLKQLMQRIMVENKNEAKKIQHKQ